MDEQSAVPHTTGVADVFDLHEVTAAATAEPVGEMPLKADQPGVERYVIMPLTVDPWAREGAAGG